MLEVALEAFEMFFQALKSSEPNKLSVTSTKFYTNLYNFLERNVSSVLFEIVTSKLKHVITKKLHLQIE